MNKITTIIKREYLTRVRTKSFILTSLLVPVFLSLVFILPALLAKMNDNESRIALAGYSEWVKNGIENTEASVEFINDVSVDGIKALMNEQVWDGVFYIPAIDSMGTVQIQYYYTKQPNWSFFGQIESVAEKALLNNRLRTYGVDNINTIVAEAKNDTRIELIKIDAKEGESINYQYQIILSITLGITIYLLIFLFSSQVIQGVMEEKTNRIVELIITSVSPVKFMIGKILGIALLGLTQIVIWIVTGSILSVFRNSLTGGSSIDFDQINQIVSGINQAGIGNIIVSFVVFFIAGYLLYSSMFAAIGSIANHNDEVQQILAIITSPLILAMLVLSGVVTNPDSAVAYWFSMIPFTSPIVMMARIIAGIPLYEALLSLLILIATVFVIMWISGKIYKVTILYTGKKVRLKDIITWVRGS